MKDALGAVQRVLVLGGGSEIAQATVQKLVAGRTRTIVLAGRNPVVLDAMPSTIALREAGAQVSCIAFDALAFETHSDFVDDTFREHDGFDLVLVAFGQLGSQHPGAVDVADAVKTVQANYTGAVSVLLPVAHRLRQQGHGQIVVLSSVAAERARAANYVYGSSKAGLDAFCQGLGDSLVGSGASLMVVRPGFVTTKMTAHLDTKPMSTTAEAVGNDIVRAIGRGDEIVWSPAKLRWVFTVLRHLPRRLFRLVKQ